MSSHPEHDATLPLPHADLLADFHLSTSTPQELPDKDTAAPPYICNTALHPHGIDVDEEAQRGFRAKSRSSTSSRNTPSLHRDTTFQFAVVFIIVWFVGIIFIYNSFDTSTGSRTGLVKYDMRFCLASPNRQVPGPQMWRYINQAGVAKCATEVLTLSARSTDIWKMRYGDEMSFGEEIQRQKVEQGLGGEDLGDDRATEGRDRALDVYPVYKPD